MKRLFTSLAALLLVAMPAFMTGCDDSDKKVNRDGELSTEVVIPTSMNVFRGMEITVEGEGFQQDDKVVLRAEKDIPAQTTILSETSLTFKVPDEVADQTVYRFVLMRGKDYQVLGASRLTVRLAINTTLDNPLNAVWGGEASIGGNGFEATDKILLKTEGGGNARADRHGRRCEFDLV